MRIKNISKKEGDLAALGSSQSVGDGVGDSVHPDDA